MASIGWKTHPEINIILDAHRCHQPKILHFYCIITYNPVTNPHFTQIYRRCTMKVSQAVDFHLQYH